MISENSIRKEAAVLLKRYESLKKQLKALEKEQHDIATQLSGLVELARGRNWSNDALSDCFGEFAPRRRATKKDAEAVRDAAFESLTRHGGVMETRSLLDQIERRGVRITGGGTTSNLAALLMQDKSRFHNVDRGQWKSVQVNDETKENQ